MMYSNVAGIMSHLNHDTVYKARGLTNNLELPKYQ